MKPGLTVVLILFQSFLLTAVSVKHVKSIPMAQSDHVFIGRAGSFLVTEDDKFVVLDYKRSNIKTYGLNGKWLKIFGQKGNGPDELITPYLSAYKKPFLAIGDFGRKTIFIYRRKPGGALEFNYKFLALRMAYDFHFLDDHTLLVSGYKADQNMKEFNLYTFDFKKKKYDFILPVEKSFGLGSVIKYRVKYKEEISRIGTYIYCDYSDDHIYTVWKGNINIAKIDRKTKQVSYFGKKTARYVQPSVTFELKEAYAKRNHLKSYQAMKAMSVIMDIFVLSSGKVGIVYAGPSLKSTDLYIMVQLYSGGGEFIREYEALRTDAYYHADLRSYFRKETGNLYILDTHASGDSGQATTVHQIEIRE